MHRGKNQAIRQQAAKRLTLNERYLRIFWNKFRRMDQYQKNDTTGRGLGRKRREEIGKRNQMTALKFQTGDKTDISGLPLGHDILVCTVCFIFVSGLILSIWFEQVFTYEY